MKVSEELEEEDRIEQPDCNYGYNIFGFQKEALAATVGSSQLKQAEAGWSRIVDRNPLITYTGTWTKYDNTLYSTGSASAALTNEATASFWFKGDKLRVIGSRNMNKSKVMKIQIDETTYLFSAYGNAQTDTLLFQKLDQIIKIIK